MDRHSITDGSLDMLPPPSNEWSDNLPLKSVDSSQKTKPHNLFSLNYLRNLMNYFGVKFMFLIMNTQFFLKGGVVLSMQSITLTFAQQLGKGSDTMQILFQMMQLPWSLKGIVGILSDVAPIFGFHKLMYMIIATILSIMALSIIIFIPVTILSSYMWLVFLSFMLIPLAPAINDLLTEGKYIRIMIEYPETKADIISYVWFCQYAGKLFVSSYTGTINDYYGSKPLLWITLIFLIQALIFLLLNFLQEKRTTTETGIDWEKLGRMKTYAILGLAMGILNVVGSTISASISINVNFIYTWTVALISITIAFLLLPTPIAKCNAYIFFSHAIIFNISGATQNWYTGSPACIPDGPHFSLSYYQTATNMITNIVVLASVFLFQSYLSKWTFKRCVYVGCALLAISHANDFIIMKRWNINYLHIPDYAMFIAGDAIIQPVLNVLNFIPGSILLARMCPKTIESTVFALLSGFSSFGYVAATATGSFVLDKLGIYLKRDGPCSAQNLPYASLICTVVAPLCILPFAHILLPDKKMSDPVSEAELSMQRKLLPEKTFLNNPPQEKM